MKKNICTTAVLGVVFFLLAQPLLAHIGGKATEGYVGDGRSGHLVTDSFGRCIHTSSWSKEAATSECDPDLVPKKVAVTESAPAPVPKAAPKAAPAPVAAPTPKAVATSEKITLAAGALFDSSKADLKPQGKKELDTLADKIKSGGINVQQIKVTGHASSTGAAAYNQSLSERRAASVKAYLVSKGIAADRIVTEGMGDRKPVASNKTAAGRAQNRRVEIEIKGQRSATISN